jgi:hypothetical protein
MIQITIIITTDGIITIIIIIIEIRIIMIIIQIIKKENQTYHQGKNFHLF